MKDSPRCKTCLFYFEDVSTESYMRVDEIGKCVEEIKESQIRKCRRFPQHVDCDINDWCGEYRKKEKTDEEEE